MGDITWSVTADFDGDAIYETDLTGYVENPGSGLRISRGIGRDGKPETSSLSLALSNRSGDFTPENGASPFYGALVPGVPIRVTATHNAVDYTLWTGYVQAWRTTWKAGAVSMTQVDCGDLFWILQDAPPVNVTASTTRDTDGALVAIMAALGFTAGDYNLDDGVQALPMHFAVGEPPLAAMMAVTASECGGLLYPAADGRVRFEARNSRLGTTADDTWGDGTSVVPIAAEYILNPLEYYTQVTARATVFRTGQADTEIFAFSQNMFTRPTATSMALAAGEVWERTFQANSAYAALTALDAGYDYTANTAIDGTGTDKTSALTATVTDLGGGRFRLRLVNTDGSTIYVTKFRLRGQPVEFFADRAEAEFELGVTGLKAGRALQFDVPFAGDTGNTLRDYAYQELRVGRYPWPTLRITFHASNDDTKVALLGAELGDLIQYTDNTSLTADRSPYVDDLWYIEAIDYQVPPDWGGKTFVCVVALVPSYVYRNLDAIVFDTFDRANATGDLGTSFSGDAWANDTGFDIVSNSARANTDTLSVPDLTVGADDQVVEVQLGAIGAGDEVGVVMRKTDASNYYRMYLDKASNEVILEKVVAGTVSELSTSAITVGTSHEMRAIVQGSRIRVWVDRVLHIDTTDSALATGAKAGLMARNASGTTTFENFYAQGL